MRQCSKRGCSNEAVATLTFNYASSTAAVGPLAATADPHAIDLCQSHADRLTVPRGWDIVRVQSRFDEPADDIDALAQVVMAPRAQPVGPDPFESSPTEAAATAPESQRARFTVVTGDSADPQASSAGPPRSRRGQLAGWVQDLPS